MTRHLPVTTSEIFEADTDTDIWEIKISNKNIYWIIKQEQDMYMY